MGRMKRFFTVTLLALMVGLSTPAVFATDGNAESPGYTTTQTTTTTTATSDGSAESPGVTDGSAESPGVYATALIYLEVLI